MGQEAPAFHIPVLRQETAAWVVCDPQGTYVDGTVGGGGHAECLLERMGEAGRLIGIDRDPDAVQEALRHLRRFGGRAEVVQAPFWKLPRILADLGVSRVDGVLFDLGVSSHQINRSERGFSYRQDGPPGYADGTRRAPLRAGGNQYLFARGANADLQGLRGRSGLRPGLPGPFAGTGNGNV